MTKIISQQRRGSLQRQLIVWINVTLITLTLAALTYDYFTQRRILITNFHAAMNQAANHVLLALKNSETMDSATMTLREYCNVMSSHEDPYHEISLITKDGDIVVSSKNTHHKTRPVIETDKQNASNWNTIVNEGNRYTSLTIPFEKRWGNNQFQGYIHYVENTNTVNSLLHRLFWNRTVSLIVIILILSIMTFKILKTKVLNPLDRIFVQSYAVSTGDYSIWNFSDPGNEIGDIQHMLNFMVEKIKLHEQSIVQKERHSAVSETIAQVYYSIGKHIVIIQTACHHWITQLNNKEQKMLIESTIKNECDEIYNDLSNLTDLFDKEKNHMSGLP